jgi:hypothetical protein
MSYVNFNFNPITLSSALRTVYFLMYVKHIVMQDGTPQVLLSYKAGEWRNKQQRQRQAKPPAARRCQ